MKTRAAAPPADLYDLTHSWETFLRSERLAPGTIDGYLSRTRMYLAWCTVTGRPMVMERAQVREWIVDLLELNEAPTVVTKLVAIKQFSRWLHEEEGLTPVDVLRGMKAPRVDVKVIEPLTDLQLQALIDACRTGGRTVAQRPDMDLRDEAVVRVMAETGARAGEVVALELGDVDTRAGFMVIRRGKGGRGRRVHIGPKTCLAIERYQRRRAAHRLADTPKLFLGAGGKGFAYDALRATLGRRASAAGIERFHPHRLRHTQAHRWLAADGSVTGLMANNGWSRLDTLKRYTDARKMDRAAAEAQKLALGEF